MPFQPSSHRLLSAEKVPTVSCDVSKHCQPTVGFVARVGYELDASSNHSFIGFLKVIDLKEEANSPRELVADDCVLGVAIGLCEQDASLGTARLHNNPTLRSPVVGERWAVIDKIEAEHADEELDGGVVGIDDEGDQMKVCHGFDPLKSYN